MGASPAPAVTAAFIISLPVGLCLAAGLLTAWEEWQWMRSR